jgi:hypothetical protein
MARKSSRKAEVQKLVKEAEKKAAQKLEEAVVQETPAPHLSEEEMEEGTGESAGEPVTPKPAGKRRGRAPLEGKSLKRLLIFVSDEDLEKLKCPPSRNPCSLLSRIE